MPRREKIQSPLRHIVTFLEHHRLEHVDKPGTKQAFNKLLTFSLLLLLLNRQCKKINKWSANLNILHVNSEWAKPFSCIVWAKIPMEVPGKVCLVLPQRQMTGTNGDISLTPPPVTMGDDYDCARPLTWGRGPSKPEFCPTLMAVLCSLGEYGSIGY